MALSDRRPIIGVMGGSRVSPDVANMAFELGALIAAQGWILLNGGRDLGVMRASAEGAKSNGRPVILMRMEMDRIFKEYTISGLLHSAQTPEECIALVQQLLVAKN